MARPLRSTSSAANNILLKVTVPKRTGQKRKRGSDEPFTDSAPAEGADPRRRTAGDVLQSLRDNVGRYQVEPVGLVQRSHMFRGAFYRLPGLVTADGLGMPDFVFSTTRSPFINRFRDQILSFDSKYPHAKRNDLTIFSRQNERFRRRHDQRRHIEC